MQHEGNGLHLDGGGVSVAHGNCVLEKVGRKLVARREGREGGGWQGWQLAHEYTPVAQLLEACNSIRNVGTADIDAMGIAKCICLEDRSKDKMWRSKLYVKIRITYKYVIRT